MIHTPLSASGERLGPRTHWQTNTTKIRQLTILSAHNQGFRSQKSAHFHGFAENPSAHLIGFIGFGSKLGEATVGGWEGRWVLPWG